LISTGMNATTGRAMSGIEHIWQSCRDILTTLVGTRIERRDYGSLLPELIDHPHNEPNNLRLMAATVMALAKWEPRITIRKINIYLGDNDGETTIDMDAVRIDGPQAGDAISINIPLGGLR
jgi:phage baseplate assembly protein W